MSCLSYLRSAGSQPERNQSETLHLSDSRTSFMVYGRFDSVCRLVAMKAKAISHIECGSTIASPIVDPNQSGSRRCFGSHPSIEESYEKCSRKRSQNPSGGR